jgi:hypothetical protein
MSYVFIMMHQIGCREEAKVGEFMQTICASPWNTGFTTHANPQASVVLRTQGRVLISVARFPPKSSGPSNVGRGAGMTASSAFSVSPSGNMHAFLCARVCLQDASAHAVVMFVKCVRSNKKSKNALSDTTHAPKRLCTALASRRFVIGWGCLCMQHDIGTMLTQIHRHVTRLHTQTCDTDMSVSSSSRRGTTRG